MIRPERPDDFAAIRAILEAAFPSPAEADLVEALRSSGNLRGSLVAEMDGKVVGHVGFSPIEVAGAPDGLGLAPLAVAEGARSGGIGGDLVLAGLEACRASGVGFVVVLGEPEYYSRFGFQPAARWGLIDEYDGGFAFQAIELRPGAIPQGGGLVRYGREFAAFG